VPPRVGRSSRNRVRLTPLSPPRHAHEPPPPRCAALSALAFSLSGPVLPAPAEPAATPLALSVGAAAVADMPFDFRPSARAGTALTLWVDGFDVDIVKLDDDRSRISAATDAAGNDLQLSFPLSSKPAQLTFELDVYEGLADVAVPLDLAVGLGLE